MKTIDLLIEERQISVDELAEAAGIGVKRMEAIAAGRWTPSPAEREKIAGALGVSVQQVSWGHTINPRNVRYHRFGLPEKF